MNKTNREELLKLLEELINIPAVTGFEDDLRNYIKKEVSPYTHTEEDQLGNLTAYRIGSKEGLHVMLCAHMDEIGYTISSIDSAGFLYLYPLGGIPEIIGPGQWVTVHTEKGIISGTTGIHSPHLKISGNPPLFADIGAGSRQQAIDMGVKVGDPVTIDYKFKQLSDDRVMGRCLDNRTGCAALITILKTLSSNNLKTNIYAVFSSTEEHGMHPGNPSSQIHGARGAFVTAQNIKPHFAIILDSMIADDIPGITGQANNIRLGKGVSLRLVDDLAIMRPRVRKLARAIAEKNCIPLQEGISRSFTDASQVQLSGAAVLTLGIPVRYVHSPGQVASISDLESAIKMVLGVINLLETAPPEWL